MLLLSEYDNYFPQGNFYSRAMIEKESSGPKGGKLKIQKFSSIDSSKPVTDFNLQISEV